MDGSASKKFLSIIAYNIRFHALLRWLFALVIIFLTPFFFGLNYLDPVASAYPLEYFVSLIGIVMLTPIFEPEINSNSKEIVEGKYLNYTMVYITRLLLSILVMFGLIICIVWYMIINNCDISLMSYTIGTFSTAMLLGSLGFFTLGITNNIVMAYMVPLAYYVFNVASAPKVLGKFYIMTLITGQNNKLKILLVSLIIMTVTIILKTIYKKVR